MSGAARHTVEVRGGSLYFDTEVYERCLRGAGAIALVRREQRLLIVPLLQPGSGGLILKIRNARGDRVVHASEFLRQFYPDESVRHTLMVQWSEEDAALVSLPASSPGI